MPLPIWTKPAVYGAIVGGIVVAVAGFTWGGWVTGSTAETRITSAANSSRADLAAAICVQNFMADEQAREHLTELVALRPTQQRTFIEEGGWAVMPDRDGTARDAATLCARMLGEIAPEELPVVDDGEVIEEGDVVELTDEASPMAEAAPAPEAPEAEEDTEAADEPGTEPETAP